MRFIEEIVVDAFLPTYRSMLAERMRDLGLTQTEVADHLSISQSAVSKYAHGEIDRHPAIEQDERVIALVERTASGLAEGTLSSVQSLIEAEVLIRELERGDLLSELHQEAVPELAEHADAISIHDPEGRLRERERILTALRTALDRLERIAGFSRFIPQVGSNLVYAREDARDIDDVAGVPGRILDIKGRATIPAQPEFGVSEHVASVLLAAREGGSTHRSALNLAFDPELLYELEVSGIRTVELEPSRDLRDGVEGALLTTPDVSVVYHQEGPGIEANIYLFAEHPEAVVDIVRSHISDR